MGRGEVVDLDFCLEWAPHSFYRPNKKGEERKSFRVNISATNWVITKLRVLKLVFSLGRKTT